MHKLLYPSLLALIIGLLSACKPSESESDTATATITDPPAVALSGDWQNSRNPDDSFNLSKTTQGYQLRSYNSGITLNAELSENGLTLHHNGKTIPLTYLAASDQLQLPGVTRQYNLFNRNTGTKQGQQP